MKTCPVCKTTLFDDMEVCYGCMHRFDIENDDGEVVAASVASRSHAEDSVSPVSELHAENGVRQVSEPYADKALHGADGSLQVPEPHVKEKSQGYEKAPAPQKGEGAVHAWTIKLEMRNQHDPSQTWAVELLVPAPVSRLDVAQAVDQRSAVIP